MGINFNELKKKAQDALTKNSDKVEQGIDKASGFAKSRFGNKADKIDDVTKKAKDYLHKQSGARAAGQVRAVRRRDPDSSRALVRSSLHSRR
ncbi:antitoxin [Prauserella oleivorans]